MRISKCTHFCVNQAQHVKMVICKVVEIGKASAWRMQGLAGRRLGGEGEATAFVLGDGMQAVELPGVLSPFCKDRLHLEVSGMKFKGAWLRVSICDEVTVRN